MFTRKLGKIIRGQATPFQLFMACLLGTMISFVPSLWNSPGLALVLLALLAVLNASLPVAALAALLGRGVFMAVTPVSFAMGRTLLHGPTEGLFRSLVNAPVVAYFGLEYYLTAGSLLLGFLWGLVLGIVVARTILVFRKKMATLEEGSEAYKKWTSKGWVRFLTWLFLGKGKGKKSYEEILSKKIGNPIRVLGVVAVVGVAGLAFVFSQFFSSGIMHASLKKGLEAANGATVDIAGVEVDFSKGRMVVNGLAMADPDHLNKDILRSARLEVDFGTKALLRKRLEVDRLVIGEATSGEKRATPGELKESTQPEEEAETPPPETDLAEAETIDKYLKDAEKWKKRLGQAKKWLDKLSGPPAEEGAPEGGEAAEGEEDASLKDRLAREAKMLGYAGVAASHLVEKAPAVVISELVLENLDASLRDDELLSIQGAHLSSHPNLLAEGPTLSAESEKKTLSAELDLAGVSASGGESKIALFYKGILVDSFADQLEVDGAHPIQGGTMDVDLTGEWPGADTDALKVHLVATLRDTTVTVAQGSAKVKELLVPIEIRGPLDNPRVSLDSGKLADALIKAGAAELANKVRAEVDKVIDKAVEKVKEEAKEALVKEAKKQLGEEVGKKLGEEVEEKLGEDLKKTTKGLLDGFGIGGKKE